MNRSYSIYLKNGERAGNENREFRLQTRETRWPTVYCGIAHTEPQFKQVSFTHVKPKSCTFISIFFPKSWQYLTNNTKTKTFKTNIVNNKQHTKYELITISKYEMVLTTQGHGFDFL